MLSLLDVAGVKVPEAAWSMSVRIPKTLIGDGERSVGLFDLLYSERAQRWASPSEGAVAMTFVDVSKAETWIRSLRAAGKRAAASAAFGLDATFDGEGLVVNARDVPTPSGPLFYR